MLHVYFPSAYICMLWIVGREAQGAAGWVGDQISAGEQWTSRAGEDNDAPAWESSWATHKTNRQTYGTYITVSFVWTMTKIFRQH